MDPQTAQWFTQKLAELQACAVPASANTEPADHSTLLPVRTDCKQESCPTCGLYFADLSSMRKRRAKKHGVCLVNPAIKSSADRAALDLAPHMVDGMPKCPHCLKLFPRPQGLRERVVAHCPVLHGSKASAAAAVSEPSASATQGTPLGHPCRESPTAPVILRSSVRQVLAGNSWHVLLKQPDLLAELKSFCVICGQWVVEGAGVKTHIRRCRPSAWKHKDTAVARTSQAAFLKGAPCHYCSLETKQAGQRLKSCVVLFQAALADILIKDYGGNSSDACAVDLAEQDGQQPKYHRGAGKDQPIQSWANRQGSNSSQSQWRTAKFEKGLAVQEPGRGQGGGSGGARPHPFSCNAPSHRAPGKTSSPLPLERGRSGGQGETAQQNPRSATGGRAAAPKPPESKIPK